MIYKFPVSGREHDRPAGDVLQPTRFPPHVVASLQKVTRAFAGQYQQKPMPSTGNLIDPLWWKLYTSDELPVFDTVLMSVDCAFKGGQTSDFVSLQKWGCAGNDCYLLEKDTRRLDFVQTEAAILAMLFSGVRTDTLLIEDKANGSAIISVLKRKGLPVTIIPVDPEGGKLSRAMAAAPEVEQGHCHLPKDISWLSSFIEQLALGPEAAANDDDIDAWSQMVIWRKTHRWAIFDYMKKMLKPKEKKIVESVTVDQVKADQKQLIRDKFRGIGMKKKQWNGST